MTRELYEGLCVGGPMAGLQGQSRFPTGFVLADSPDGGVTGRVWIYDWSKEQQFSVRRTAIVDDSMQLDPEKLKRAASGSRYDVRAYDPEVMR